VKLKDNAKLFAQNRSNAYVAVQGKEENSKA
jgi:hypothetical protein